MGIIFAGSSVPPASGGTDFVIGLVGMQTSALVASSGVVDRLGCVDLVSPAVGGFSFVDFGLILVIAGSSVPPASRGAGLVILGFLGLLRVFWLVGS